MDKRTRVRLERAGFWFGDAEDFLGLTAEERQMVELRLQLSRLVRRLREEHGLTQQQLAQRMRSSQSRVAKIEAGEADVSLDLSFRALFAAGGGLAHLAESSRRAKRRKQTARPRAAAESKASARVR